MILNRTGAEFEYEGVTYTIGGAIVGTAESEYAGLYGRINAIHDGEDKETENETPDIYQRLITNPMIPECIERHLGRNDHYWEAYWESVSEAAHGLVRQASKQPDCFTPEADNPYPLCIGSGKSACDDCCLYLHMKGEGGYEC